MSKLLKQKIIQLLIERGNFKQKPGPLMVADTNFEFDNCFVGPGESDSLVLVSEVNETQIDLFVRRIRGLKRSLVRSKSTRTLAVIVFGLKVIPRTLSELESYCRVINILPSDDVERSVSELLKLEIPSTTSLKIQPEKTLLETLSVDEKELFDEIMELKRSQDFDFETAALHLFESKLDASLGGKND